VVATEIHSLDGRCRAQQLTQSLRRCHRQRVHGCCSMHQTRPRYHATR
jgi:hypothetical protein